jgi:hypothetical protein
MLSPCEKQEERELTKIHAWERNASRDALYCWWKRPLTTVRITRSRADATHGWSSNTWWLRCPERAVHLTVLCFLSLSLALTHRWVRWPVRCGCRGCQPVRRGQSALSLTLISSGACESALITASRYLLLAPCLFFHPAQEQSPLSVSVFTDDAVTLQFTFTPQTADETQ